MRPVAVMVVEPRIGLFEKTDDLFFAVFALLHIRHSPRFDGLPCFRLVGLPEGMSKFAELLLSDVEAGNETVKTDNRIPPTENEAARDYEIFEASPLC